MSDRITEARAPGGFGIADWGRKPRAEMVQRYRDYYQRQLKEAQMALAVPDADIVVETYLGPYAMKNRETVQ